MLIFPVFPSVFVFYGGLKCERFCRYDKSHVVVYAQNGKSSLLLDTGHASLRIVYHKEQEDKYP